MGPRLKINRMPVEAGQLDTNGLVRMLEIASDALWQWDLRSNRLSFDSRFYAVTGYEPDNFPSTYDEWTGHIHPDDRDGVEKQRAACMAGDQNHFEGTYRFRTRAGGWIWLHSRGKAVEQDMDGGPVQMAGVISDITEAKEAEKVRRHSDDRYRTVLENALDAIIIAQDGWLRYANPSMERIMGYTREELTRVPFDQMIHEDDRRMVADRHRRRLGGDPVPDYYTFRAVHKTGKTLCMEINTVCIQWEGEPAIQAFLRDITRTKLMEKQLFQAQKMQAIGTLAGGIAHDFNNILAAMMGYTEICLAELATESPLAPKLERVLLAGDRAKDLVNRILAFSRQADIDQKPVSIGPVIDEAMKLLRASIPSTIDFRLDLAKTTAPVMADPTRIHQIVMNLCTNAAHAMKSGGSLEIHLADYDVSETEASRYLGLEPGPYARLTVADTGHGMDPETAKRIFDPYFTTKKQGEGTGLGLSVVHGIVSNMGGAIKVYTEQGEGTTFHLYLPQIKSSIHTGARAAIAHPRGTESILLVDDEAFVLDMTAEMLESLGYKVTRRISSVEALQAFRAAPDRFDLVVTDQTMPHLSGVAMAEKILEIRNNMPLILCTGFSAGLTEKKLRATGIRAFLNKPVLKAEMASAVRNVLAR